MKKEFTWFMEFKNCAIGLGWNEEKQTVECSNEWWDEHLARCNNPDRGIKCNHVRFRKKGPKYIDDLHILFDKIHVTGPNASSPDNLSSCESSDDQVAEVEPRDIKLTALKRSKSEKKKRKGSFAATDEKGENSPFFRLYKNTCSRTDTVTDRISTSVEAPSVAAPSNQVPTIAAAMKMVKDCGVQEKTALMHTATFLIMKPEFREVLTSFETNEGRFDLLQREHEKDSMKRM